MFAKGNRAAKGGRRAGAGRKPDAVRAAARDFWAGRREAAIAVIDAALDLGRKDPDVTYKDRLKAAELVLAYAEGRPVQRVEAQHRHDPAADMIRREELTQMRAVVAAAAQEKRR